MKRRSSANEREKKRMHLLNQSLDKLRRHMPLPYNIKDFISSSIASNNSSGEDLKLPKIETLILAKNYIQVLVSTLEDQKLWKHEELINMLSKGLRDNTVNLLKNKLMLDQELMNEIFCEENQNKKV